MSWLVLAPAPTGLLSGAGHGLSLRGPPDYFSQPRCRIVMAGAHHSATEGLVCTVPLSTEPKPHSELFDVGLALLPFAIPTIAFGAYDEILRAVTYAIDTLSPGDWYAVDGGTAQVVRLQPTINGVVIPAISIALGTLSAATIQTLRQRQVAMRTTINKEACKPLPHLSRTWCHCAVCRLNTL